VIARRGIAIAALAILCTLGAPPAAAFAHAYLVHTSPAPNAVLLRSPRQVALTFDEAVEPRFAIISVTDANGQQLTTAPVSRSPTNPDTLVVPLKPHLPPGWYLIYWRAISIDGHPVQGGYTWAIGPNPGPVPEFAIPHISETATSTNLLITRWLMFLTVMVTLGLFVFRTMIARPVARRFGAGSLRPLTIACLISGAAALVAVPVYLDTATAIDSLRSPFELSALLPLFHVTAFGRAYEHLEICLALFAFAAVVTLWLDRPDRARRSVAELFALTGALAGAAAVLLIPGLAGHAGQTAPRGLAVTLDWLHLVSGSLWLGGLIGLIVLAATVPRDRRIAALSVAVPRFSNVALASVLVLLGSGVWASILHLPILSALWTTSYGVAILVKAGLLAVAMVLGAVNLLRNRPQLIAARDHEETGQSAARLLRTMIGVEALLVTAAVFAAAVLSSLAPPAAALAQIGSALATVGPGQISSTVQHNGYTIKVLVDPNKVAQQNNFAVRITKGGQPVRGANVTMTVEMLDMQMQNQEYQMTETAPGVYSHAAPALVMTGRWGLLFNVTPKNGTEFPALIVDHAAG
jgi:copper transport protein